ncbi:MAG: BON domain-containing protein [Gemmataceae bacterium]
MRKLRKLAPLASILFLGCNDQDTQRLAEVGRVTARRLEELTGGSPDRVRARLASVSGQLDDAPVDRRVAVRIRWDKLMKDAFVNVQAAENQIELTGTVTSDEQRRRAVEIAEATDGVTAVIDKIEVKENE